MFAYGLGVHVSCFESEAYEIEIIMHSMSFGLTAHTGQGIELWTIMS